MTQSIRKYEELLDSLQTVRDSMRVIEEYLNCRPNLDDLESYYNLVVFHASTSAVVSLTVDKVDALLKEHREALERYIKEEAHHE